MTGLDNLRVNGTPLGWGRNATGVEKERHWGGEGGGGGQSINDVCIFTDQWSLVGFRFLFVFSIRTSGPSL